MDETIENCVKNIDEIIEYCAEEGIDTYYIISILPIADINALPDGVEDYSHKNAKRLLETLEMENIPIIDLRSEKMIEAIDKEKLFYKIDHHWTVESCFAAF